MAGRPPLHALHFSPPQIEGKRQPRGKRPKRGAQNTGEEGTGPRDKETEALYTEASFDVGVEQGDPETLWQRLNPRPGVPEL